MKTEKIFAILLILLISLAFALSVSIVTAENPNPEVKIKVYTDKQSYRHVESNLLIQPIGSEISTSFYRTLCGGQLRRYGHLSD